MWRGQPNSGEEAAEKQTPPRRFALGRDDKQTRDDRWKSRASVDAARRVRNMEWGAS
jgi:hypothetical protein